MVGNASGGDEDEYSVEQMERSCLKTVIGGLCLLLGVIGLMIMGIAWLADRF